MKDLRTGVEKGNPEAVLDGDLDGLWRPRWPPGLAPLGARQARRRSETRAAYRNA